MDIKVSIITPTFNSERFIKVTLDSIAQQTYPHIEHIICDNMSSDRTIEICSQYKNIIIQKKDNSMYEAINNGIRESTGDILCFLNSDDIYPNNTTIEKMVDIFRQHPFADVIYGKSRMVDEKLRYLYTHKPLKCLTYEKAKKRFFIINHASTFFRKQVFNRFGLYREDLKFTSDCEYLLRLLSNRVTFIYCEDELSVFRRHDANLSDSDSACKDYIKIATLYNFNTSYVLTKIRFYMAIDNIFNFNYWKFIILRYFKNI